MATKLSPLVHAEHPGESFKKVGLKIGAPMLVALCKYAFLVRNHWSPNQDKTENKSPHLADGQGLLCVLEQISGHGQIGGQPE